MRSFCGERKIIEDLAEGRKTLWELLASYHWSLRDFIRTVNRLYEEGVIGSDGRYIYLQRSYRRKGTFGSARCPRCLGRAVLPAGYGRIRRKFERLLAGRPKPEIKFFQGYMRPDDVFARIAIMHSYDDVEDRSIILVGDDDLVSLALALTQLPRRITVLDVDERLGDFIGRVSRQEGLEVEFIAHDVRDPLPAELRRKFDVFVTDPLETVSGLRAFLARAACALKPYGSAGYFGLTTLEASFGKWLWLQRFLAQMNLAITDAIREHSSYPTKDYGIGFPYEEEILKRLKFKYDLPPNVDWYKSTFFRVVAVGRVKPPACSRRISLRVHDSDDVTWPGGERTVS